MPTLDDLDDEQIRRAARLLERENHKLIDKVTRLECRVRELEGQQPTQLELRIAELERQLAERNRMLFGDKSERREGDGDQPRQVRSSKPGHGPQSQPELPIVEEHHELDDADKSCPSCGGDLQAWDGQTEDSDEVDVIERRFVILRRRRQKYRCKCGGCVETAPAPSKLVPGGRYSTAFALAVAIAKYADHLPLERQVTMMRRQGLNVTSQTLWDQIEALAAKLEPLYERLGEYIRSQPVLGADETPWKMLRPRKKDRNKRWYAWALAAPDAVMYRIESSRSAEAGGRVIGDYDGTLVCDGYTAYHAIKKRGASFRVAHCWAHARRKFWEIEPAYPDKCGEILDLIRKLYDVEAQTKDLPPDERLEARRARAGPIVKRIHQWALTVETLPESALGKAVAYLGTIWDGLQVFLEDPKVTLDNNAVERTLRVVVVGRKNHYGSHREREAGRPHARRLPRPRHRRRPSRPPDPAAPRARRQQLIVRAARSPHPRQHGLRRGLTVRVVTRRSWTVAPSSSPDTGWVRRVTSDGHPLSPYEGLLVGAARKNRMKDPSTERAGLRARFARCSPDQRAVRAPLRSTPRAEALREDARRRPGVILHCGGIC